MSESCEQTLAVVTGASSGIGRQVARRLAARGCRTLLVARRRERLERLAAELSEQAESHVLGVDLADAQQVEAIAHKLFGGVKGGPGEGAWTKLGPVEVLVNNAGYGDYRPFLEQTPAEHHRLMQVNYFAAATLTRMLLPAMLKRGRGHVINMASMAAKMGPWGHAGYAPAKAALVNLTQVLAAEYGHTGLHFSYVNPGLVDTDFFDSHCFSDMPAALKRRALPVDKAARKIVHLLDHPRLELCIPRHYRLLDLLQALSPKLAHTLVCHNTTSADAGKQHGGKLAGEEARATPVSSHAPRAPTAPDVSRASVPPQLLPPDAVSLARRLTSDGAENRPVEVPVEADGWPSEMGYARSSRTVSRK